MVIITNIPNKTKYIRILLHSGNKIIKKVEKPYWKIDSPEDDPSLSQTISVLSTSRTSFDIYDLFKDLNWIYNEVKAVQDR